MNIKTTFTSSRLQSLSQATGIVSAAIGLLVLIGWEWNVEFLKRMIYGGTAANPITAIGFILAGVSLRIYADDHATAKMRRFAKGLASIIVAFCLLWPLTALFGWHQDIDQMLFRSKVAIGNQGLPSHIAPNTAVNFVLLGAALLLLEYKTRHGRWPAQNLAALVSAIAFLALLGYSYGEPNSYGMPDLIPMALPTAITFIVLALGILLARPDRGLMTVFTSEGSAGAMVRRSLPLAIVIPSLIGWVQLQAYDQGVLGAWAVSSLLTTAYILFFSVLIVWNACRMCDAEIDQMDAEKALRASEERFRSLFENSTIGLYRTTPDGEVLLANPRLVRMLGYATFEELSARREATGEQRSYVAGHNRREFLDAIESTGEIAGMESRWVRADGSSVLVCESARAIRNVDGTVLYYEGTVEDVTERRSVDEALRLYRLLAESASDIMLFARADGTILEANAAAVLAYGYSREELLKSKVHDLRVPDSTPASLLQLSMAATGATLSESVHQRKDGSCFPVEISGQSSSLGGETLIITVTRDVTERKTFEDQLRHQALHDALTGLPNRLLFEDRLGHALASMVRRTGQVAVIFIDLDRFKHINDSLGHQAGDTLLMAVATRISKCVRAEDTVSRLGGDEFTVLLEGVDGEKATKTAERILHELLIPFDIDGVAAFVSASIGIVLTAGNESISAEVMQDADVAMYQAKATGKSKYVIFEREMNLDAVKRFQLEADLRHAIDRNQFLLHYQPVVGMKFGHVIGLESLVRWQHPVFGLMPPDEFIPIQEQLGLVGPLTLWVLHQSLAQCQFLHHEGFPATIAVNVSVLNLLDPDFPDKVGALLSESGLPPNCLKLELTESAMMGHPDRTAEALISLHALGLGLSIDDFGTGYSSLAYLKHLPVHEIKIDKSFVFGMNASSEEDTAIVRSTIALAHNLNKTVVAEGVESQAVWDMLRDLGCDVAQGYLMGRPMPSSQLTDWLRTSPWGLKSNEPAAPERLSVSAR